MQVQDGIFTITLFMGYITLWYIKRGELLKSDGVEANVISKAIKPIQKYFAALERGMTISIVLIIIIHFLFKNDTQLTRYIHSMDSFGIKALGFLLGIIGLSICRMAQVAMGNSWRVGIDEHAKPGLIISGLYRYMRNPTYTGLFLLCIGVWVINPTFLYSYWILVFFIMIEFQVRCEEEYLEAQYGEEYVKYSKRTKRYIPMVY